MMKVVIPSFHLEPACNVAYIHAYVQLNFVQYVCQENFIQVDALILTCMHIQQSMGGMWVGLAGLQ
jgi:hypothetical protein